MSHRQTSSAALYQHSDLGDTLNSYLEGIAEETEAPLVEVTDSATDIEMLLRNNTHALVDTLFNVLLGKAVRSGATDMHVEPSLSELWVRYRVDGEFGESFRLPKWLHAPLIGRCKLLAKLDVNERPVPQRRRITLRYQGSQLDLRVSSMPTQLGEKVTLQILERHIELDGQPTPEPEDLQALTDEASGPTYGFDDTPAPQLAAAAQETNVPVIEITDEDSDVGRLLHDSSLAPVAKLLSVLLRKAIRSCAGEVHIEPTPSDVWVRYRIDGTLAESVRLPKWLQDPLVGRCKLLAQLDLNEHQAKQDGKITLQYQDALVALRVSTLATQHGEKITMRIIDLSAAPTALSGLDLSERDLAIIRRTIQRPDGMILVTGPSQSGKTSTLYALLREIISPNRNIVTLENRIDSRLPGVNQIPIDEQPELTFASSMRWVLRQDPDVIVIDEISDPETAGIALRAAETGHLVLAGLQSHDAAAALSRLLDLGIDPDALASAPQVVIAQRLVRRICTECAEAYTPDGAALRALHLETNGHPFVRGRGCPACRKSGYAGRTAVFEVVPVTRKLAALIEGKATESALRVQAREEGTPLLVDNAAHTIHAGRTTVEEVLRVLKPPSSTTCPTCQQDIEKDWVVCPHCAASLCSSSTVAETQSESLSNPHRGASAAHSVSPPPPESAAPLPTSAPPEIGSEGATRRYRVLLVDDQQESRQLVRRTLEGSGLPLSVVEASDGHQGLELAQADVPDVVVLDVMMPGLSGFEVCERLREDVRTAFVPILMLTALDDSGNRVRGFHAGTDDYLGKPFARAELLARVCRLIERSYGATLQISRAAH